MIWTIWLALIVAVLAVLTITDARQTLHYVRTPDYTFTSAADQIRRRYGLHAHLL